MSGAWLWIAIASLLLTLLFATIEASVREASRVDLERLLIRKRLRARATRNEAEDEDSDRAGSADLEAAGAHPSMEILADPEGHAVAAAVPRALFAALVAVASVIFASGLVAPGKPIGALGAAIGLSVAAVLLWLCVSAIPQSVAAHGAERVLLATCWLARVLHAVTALLRRLVSGMTEIVRRLVGEEAMTEEEESEAEILSLVSQSEAEGTLDEGARDMIEAVVEFRSTTVENIMTPRTELEALEYTDDLEEVKRFAESAGHSRLPVYEESLDTIVGVLYAKDLLRWLVSEGAAHKGEHGESFSLRELLREATYVPETKTVRELLKELLDAKVHIAFATDEYGGISGIVTIEDIVEEIIGEIRDEYEPEEPVDSGVTLDERNHTAEIDARTEIDDANDELESIGLEIPEADEYDTVGGFVVVTMGKIPEAGETLRHNGLIVTVLDAEPTRVKRVRVEPAPETADVE